MSKINADRRKLLAWTPPIISAVIMPAHAQTSATTAAPTTSAPTTAPPTTAAPVCVNNVTEQDSIPREDITWDKSLTVAQYNGPGTLSQVVVRIFAQIDAVIEVENRDQQPKTITADLNGAVDVSGPASLPVPISASNSVDLDGFDGTLDFGGTSGTSFSVDSGEQMVSVTLAPDAFIGTGTVTFNASASGTVVITGSASLTSSVSTFASARIEVEYICA